VTERDWKVEGLVKDRERERERETDRLQREIAIGRRQRERWD